MNKFLRKIKWNFVKWSSRVPIPRYKNVSLYNVLHFYLESLRKGQIGHRSASISFRFLTALFPLCIFLFSIIPFIPISNLQDNLMIGLENFFPKQIFGFFHEILVDLTHKKKAVLLSVGFLLSIYFASNAVNALITGLTASHHINRKRKFWRQRLWSLGLLFAFLFLFILAFLITSTGQWLIDYAFNNRYLESKAGYWTFVILKSALSLFTFMFSISLLYNVANTDKIKWKFFNAGAITSTLLIIVLKETFGLYIMYFGKFDQVYGPIGTGLAFLLFVFYMFIILIIGFELNVSLQQAYRYKNAAEFVKPKKTK
ncbi:MAG TPA: YihY/virulence factor BrkB family protein [Flavobacteriales bacterium]|nr:YihY/virulence factor BrkB family protein [Flavobacteriales bacterium]